MSTYSDRASQLIADFQHAMDSSSPISSTLMDELKTVLDMGSQADAVSEALQSKMENVQAEVGDLMKTVGPS